MLNGTDPTGSGQWSDGFADALGYVTRIAFALDGYAVTRNDCVNGYLWDPAKKRNIPIMRADDNYDGSTRPYQASAARMYEVDICWSDSTRAYFIADGYLWRTDDRFKTIARLTAWNGGAYDAALSIDGTMSNAQRIGGSHLAIDPANKDVLIVCPPDRAPYITVNAGASFALISGLPVPTNNIGSSAKFDLNSGTTSGKTNRVAIVTAGRGVYISTTTATGTFSASSGAPTTGCNQIDWASGKLLLFGSGIGNSDINILSGGTWSAVGGGRIAVCGAVNPLDQTKVVAFSEGGACHYSTDTASTWTTTDNFPNKFLANDVPIISYTRHSALLPSYVAFDPTLTNIPVVTNGIGVFSQATLPTSGSTPWVSRSVGIKQLIFQTLVVGPDGTVVGPNQDRGVVASTYADAKRQAWRHGPDLGEAVSGLQNGQDADYFADTPTAWVMTRQPKGAVGALHLSVNKAVDWAPVANADPWSGGGGGNIAAGAYGNFVIAPTQNAQLRVTDDMGATYANPTLDGVDSAGMGFHTFYYLRRKILINDKAGSYWLLRQGQGLYRSIDGGHAFLKKRGVIEATPVSDLYNVKLRAVPGHPGHLFYARGVSDGYPTPAAADGLLFSSDGDGVTFDQLSGWAGVEDVSLGKAAPGKSYPSVWVVGWRSGVRGVWASYDFDPITRSATWHLWAKYPMGYADDNVIIAACPVNFGRLYYGPSGGGVLVGDYGTKLLQT